MQIYFDGSERHIERNIYVGAGILIHCDTTTELSLQFKAPQNGMHELYAFQEVAKWVIQNNVDYNNVVIYAVS